MQKYVDKGIKTSPACRQIPIQRASRGGVEVQSGLSRNVASSTRVSNFKRHH